MDSATRVTISVFGVLAGLAGIEHGIGEVVQGNKRPDGILIRSWEGSETFQVLNGEPAMTIVPNLLVTGILAILLSLVFLLWVTVFIERERGGHVLILISGVMLLVGGGFGPPLLGIILGTVAMKIHKPLTWWRTNLTAGSLHRLASLWIWFLVAGVAAWLTLMPGVLVLDLLLSVTNPDALVLIVMVTAFALLGLAIITALASDAYGHLDGCMHPRRASNPDGEFNWRY
jgi:hypothetical protein